MSDRPSTDHDLRINAQLTALHQRLCMRGVAATWRSPDIEAIEAEEQSLTGQAQRFFAEEMSRDEQRLADFRKLFVWFFGHGPDPREVLKRQYAVAQALFPDLLGHMSKSDIGRMFDETKASASWRTKQIFGRLGCHAPGARGAEVRGKNAEAARRRHAAAAERRAKKLSNSSHS